MCMAHLCQLRVCHSDMSSQSTASNDLTSIIHVVSKACAESRRYFSFDSLLNMRIHFSFPMSVPTSDLKS